MELALKCDRCGKVHVGIIAEECMECGASLSLTQLDPNLEKEKDRHQAIQKEGLK
ncbi:MAG: hypothetical protein H0Z33_11090 [Bacillaceae bacterium]|nr:hypothetical protein [Bacillaceae bacterium]